MILEWSLRANYNSLCFFNHEVFTLNDLVKSLTPFLSSPKLLPGESESEFQASLEGLLSELENPSPLNITLVTQLNECLWWIKRHTVDKELLLNIKGSV
jgi:hypothetical protein